MHNKNNPPGQDRTATPVITPMHSHQQHLANDPKRPSINVNFGSFGSYDTNTSLRHITVRDTELMLQLEKVCNLYGLGLYAL